MQEPTDRRVADVLRIQNRFLRSAQLERDFRDPDVFSGYVMTDFTRSCLDRLSEGLKPLSSQRAWRLTGDYGSGKSSFALLLAHWFAGHDASFPPQILKAIDSDPREPYSRQMVPALVTCAREPLLVSILKGLRLTLTEIGKPRNSSRLLLNEVDMLLQRKEELSDGAVLDLILKIHGWITANSKGAGLLLLIDELGKFLEFAAINPQGQDVFLLQRLAEAACRSGEQPFFVVCLLHQGFSAYADSLNQSAQREWEKVAGRFEEIVFNQPLEQIARLIASAINVRTEWVSTSTARGLKKAIQQTSALGWFGHETSKGLSDLAVPLYPLHPTVVPVLIRVFRRFGQNERSLFSFLMSNEPFGLRAFSERQHANTEPYCLHDLYDYVRASFGHRLAAQSYRSHWNLIESFIESFSTNDDVQLRILKTVGILNLLNDGDLVPTEEAVICALAGHDDAYLDQVKAGVETLHKVRRVLYDRGRARGLCLWPHTSVDLEKAYDEARRAVEVPQKVAPFIQEYIETRPIVARRHYVETGNLRHYEVRYCSVAELSGLLEETLNKADGRILIPLCETLAEWVEALEFAQRPEFNLRPTWLVAVPQPLGNLAGLVQEVGRWEWIATNTEELNGDQFAREELSRQLAATQMQLENRIQGVVGIRQVGPEITLNWFHHGHPLAICNGRNLLSELSRIFDETYPSAPRIHNEMVNRRSLSSAAAAARMRLIERMFADPSKLFLGMDPDKKPPEMSMYLSVLKQTGLHRQDGDAWQVGEPHHRADRYKVLPALRMVRETVQKRIDGRVNVAALFEELRKPPYGVRDGLIPLFLTVFTIAHEKDIAFYKDGTFLPQMTAEAMLVLTKAPERFEIQYCKVTGMRAALFEDLLEVLDLGDSDTAKGDILDLVRPLCVFVAQLPTYALNTKRLSPKALAVRDRILNARDPAKLVFSDLPLACGFEPIPDKKSQRASHQAFVITLKAAVDELRTAYPLLSERMRKRLREAFVLPGSFQQFRELLSARAEHILLTVTEPKLRAFCLRLLDDKLAESEWLESVGSYLALKPPSKWHDAEEDRFESELGQIAAKFHRVESITFTDGATAEETLGVRVSVTQPNGSEHEQIVHFTVEEEHKLLDLQTKFETLLAQDQRLGLAAASRAIWKSLDKVGDA